MKNLFITLIIAFFIIFFISIYGDIPFCFDKYNSNEEFVDDTSDKDEISINKMKYGNLAKEIKMINTPEKAEDLEEDVVEVEVGMEKKIYTISELQIEEMRETHSITHEKDGTSYTLVFLWDEVPLIVSHPHVLYNFPVSDRKTSNENYRIHLFNQESNLLQSFNLEDGTFSRLKFEDVNLDGYTDIVVNTGGTWNETHDFYIWDMLTQNFTKVIFEGFNMLSFYEVKDGYIKNFLRGSTPDESEMQKLIWNGNHLILESVY